MPSSVGDINIYKVSIGDLYSISKISVGEKVVYSAGNVVIYHVETGVTYQEEVDEGESCLAQKTFTPSKSGWDFVGWRTDSTASGTVLASKVMGDDPITLYAVFRQAITVTYYNNSTAASSTSGYRYYNNGAVANPSFTLTQAASSGWTCRGWSTSNKGDAGITYANGATFTRSSDITLYGLYSQTITVTYYDNSTTAKTTTGTRYWAPAGAINPSFTLTQAASSGWTCRGWSTSNKGDAGITYANGATFTRDSNVTLYGLYQQTITVNYYNDSANASKTTGTRYWAPAGYINPSFTLTQSSKYGWTARGWSTSTAGNGGITYNNATAFTRDSNITLYGMYYQTITLTYYNGSTTASTTSGTRYYGSGPGNVVNPTFSLTPATLSGWTFRGWATSSAATAGIAYSSISNTAFAVNTTVYAAYSQTITLSYSGNGETGGSTAAQTGTRYWNTGNVSNPSFTLAANGFSRSGYNFSKWAMGSTGGTQYSAGTSVTFSASTTMYAVWVSAGYYAIKDGRLVAAPSAYAWSDGYSNSHGALSGNYGAFYGAVGHTSGSDQSWGATTGKLPTNGCTHIDITVMDSTWGSDAPYAQVKVIGSTSSGAQTTIASYTPRSEGAAGKITRTFTISAYTYITVTIEAVTYGDEDAWVGVGFTDVRFY